MVRLVVGRPIVAALLLYPVAALADPVLSVIVQNSEIVRVPMPDQSEICLHWSHSVTGGAVADCFVNRAGTLVLDRAYLHDFAAGLGEVAGRGTLTPAPQGGSWIIDMAEPLPDNQLTLRIGPARVGHRLEAAGQTVALSDLSPNTRAELRLLP